MGLHSLRQHISIIPQTPFIFKGTIRQNLDPFEAASDDQIEQVVSDSGLSLCIKSV
jgi:ABC-type multidrug transport system fused ATPase/permease subunit